MGEGRELISSKIVGFAEGRLDEGDQNEGHEDVRLWKLLGWERLLEESGFG